MSWSTIAEEDAIVASLGASARCSVDVLGETAQGRPIRLLRVGMPPPVATSGRALLLIVGGQHGNEIAGREAVLEYAQHLVDTTDPDDIAFLETRGILLLPTCNPDGVHAGIRRNSNDVDTNRTHIQLSEAESEALGRALGDYRPLVIMDLHETSQEEDVTFLWPTNPQVASIISTEAEDIVTALKARATAEAWTSGNYSGGTAETILRNVCGLRHAFGVLVETDRSDSDEAKEIKRQAIHYACIEECVHYALDNETQLRAAAESAVAAKIAEGAAGNTAFNVELTTIDPPPLGYELSSAHITATGLIRSAFNLDLRHGNIVRMDALTQPVTPFILDDAAEFSTVSATRLAELPEIRTKRYAPSGWEGYAPRRLSGTRWGLSDPRRVVGESWS